MTEEIIHRAFCEDCGREYGLPGFPDLIIPLDVWKQISTRGDETGLLCPSCICARLETKGLRCTGAFMSGPIESVSGPTMNALRRVENAEINIARIEKHLNLNQWEPGAPAAPEMGGRS